MVTSIQLLQQDEHDATAAAGNVAAALRPPPLPRASNTDDDNDDDDSKRMELVLSPAQARPGQARSGQVRSQPPPCPGGGDRRRAMGMGGRATTTRTSTKATTTTTTTTTRRRRSSSSRTTTTAAATTTTTSRSTVEAAELEVEVAAASSRGNSSKRKAAAAKPDNRVDAVIGNGIVVDDGLLVVKKSSRSFQRVIKKRKVVKDGEADGKVNEEVKEVEVKQKEKKKPRRKAPVQVERLPGERRYYLLKSEPDSRIENGVDFKFGIDELIASPDSTAFWDGVRNYQARNILQEMRVGDQAFFYHSNCKRPGIAGVVEVVKEAVPDKSAFDPKSACYDPKSDAEDPRWFGVEVKFQRKLSRFISLDELKAYKQQEEKEEGKGGQLAKMSLFTAARLSVHRVRLEEWEFILSLENKPD